MLFSEIQKKSFKEKIYDLFNEEFDEIVNNFTHKKFIFESKEKKEHHNKALTLIKRRY